ncbi:hypothetical protein [Pseudoruegeria sp. SK021]|uniref:TRAFAC clade GTPase domain-containing protein n=1 Tax=Pseudoruegeria sp. SK021 TaxID=1933035 RepID=UPI000A25003E|nr:hypothetical protein [Pseudoruegeria sp. SK021]OSP53504.1 hypothetical protein BV911_17625 [Pseudoruegeria sp. SK021]
MSQKQHVILGYPDSGKTTFLAALWHILDAGSASSIVLDKISGDVRYLNEIKRIWLKCEQVPRTLTSSEELVEMHVRDATTSNRSVLRLPDFSGETFLSLIADRECEEDFVSILQDSDGILFFVNADRANDALFVTDFDFPDEGSEPEQYIAAERDETAEADRVVDFDPRRMPEQTRIIDILQILQAPVLQKGRRRLVIAISAWDVVAADEVEPSEWLAREMPMLAQYLATNSELYDVCHCGISAQGGSFEGEARNQLLAVDPANRVQCRWDEKTTNDITLPLTWLNDDDA